MNKVTFCRNTFLVLFIALALTTVYSKFLSSPETISKPGQMDEKFDEDFLYVNSLEKLDSLIFTKFRESHYDTAQTVLFIDNFLRSRFYHDYSRLTLKDNWIAVVCGKLLWSHFLFPVAPRDIIQYPMAACSQQGIIFQRLLEHLKIPSSTIQFFPLSAGASGHYAVSVYYSNNWHFYDPNREPFIVDSTMPSIEKIIDGKLYEKMYAKPSNQKFQSFFKEKSYKRVTNEQFHGGNMYYFQILTAFLSSWLWLGALLGYLMCARYSMTKKAVLVS